MEGMSGCATIIELSSVDTKRVFLNRQQTNSLMSIQGDTKQAYILIPGAEKLALRIERPLQKPCCELPLERNGVFILDVPEGY